MAYCIALLCLGSAIVGTHAGRLYEMHSWKYVDYLWNSPAQKQNAIDSGDYITNSNIPFDVDQAPDGRVFVTVMRDKGIPATLTTVSNKIGAGGPLLRPYPNWTWNTIRNDCKGLVGVWRVKIKCNHLWVLDSGKSGEIQVCPAQLLIFDLSTDRLVKRIIIPSKYSNNVNGTGLLVTPIVDIWGGCRNINNAKVYMADTEGYGLVVWNGMNLKRLESKYFDPEESATHFTVAGTQFTVPDGILGMDITVDEPNPSKRLLYFRPLASFYMSYVNVANLQWNLATPSAISYRTNRNKMRSQSAAQAFSKRGILFFSSTSDESIICWNRHKPFDLKNTVPIAVDYEALQFASGMKVTEHSDKLILLTNRYQKVATDTMNFTDVNFRIITGFVHELVRGTNCE